MLKGFPNQIVKLDKLSRALAVLADLDRENQDWRDDEIFGEALLKEGVIKYRAQDLPLDGYLAEQRRQDKQDRSYCTSARGLREFFRYAGCIRDGSLTELASVLAGNDRDAWRVSIAGIHIGSETSGYSHPYRVLLRLVEKRPGMSRRFAALCLEARDDSDQELARICALVDLQDEAAILKNLGARKSNWDNAKKVFPALAEQLGDVIKQGENLFLVPDVSLDFESSGRQAGPGRIGREVTVQTIAVLPKTGNDGFDTSLLPEGITPEEIASRNAKTKDRLTRHNVIVRRLAEKMMDCGANSLRENPFDCLGIYGDDGLMVEVKSLEDEADEVVRVREALGQLRYYGYFRQDPRPDRLVLCACFERKPSLPHIQWLESNDIAVIWCKDQDFEMSPASESRLSRFLK